MLLSVAAICSNLSPEFQTCSLNAVGCLSSTNGEWSRTVQMQACKCCSQWQQIAVFVSITSESSLNALCWLSSIECKAWRQLVYEGLYSDLKSLSNQLSGQLLFNIPKTTFLWRALQPCWDQCQAATASFCLIFLWCAHSCDVSGTVDGRYMVRKSISQHTALHVKAWERKTGWLAWE